MRAVAPITVIVLIVAACGSSDDDASPATSALSPTPTTTTATTTSPTITSDEAMAVSGEFVDAFNSGDADAVLALFTSNVALSEKYTGMSDSFEEFDRAFFDQLLAWSTAQGTTFTSPECAVTDDSAGAEVTVSCEFGWLYPAEKAAGAPPVPTLLTMVVTPDGVSGLAFEYPPEFGLASFDNWLFLNHKEDSQGVEYGDWNSVAEAQQGGTLRAKYVAEWAADFEANSGTTGDPTATYTGGACDYDGPSEFDVNSTVTFTVTNESDTTNMGFSVWSVPEGTTADEILEEGIFVVVGGGPPVDPEKGFYAALFAPTAIDSTGTLTVTLDKPGQHALNCFDLTDSGGDHAIMFTVSDN